MIFLLQDIKNITLGEIGIYIAALIAIIKTVYDICKKGNTALKKWHDSKNIQEEKDETIETHSKQIAEMDTRHKEDYKQINGKIDALTFTLNGFIEETKKDNQVMLRDKIYDAYKIALQKGYLLEKDAKNYHYALERYLANNGNSYIIDEVEPRMKEMKIFLSDQDAEDYLAKK